MVKRVITNVISAITGLRKFNSNSEKNNAKSDESQRNHTRQRIHILDI